MSCDKFKEIKQTYTIKTLQNGKYVSFEGGSTEREYMCKIDIKDAYFSVSLHREFQKFVRFQWKGQLFYDFDCFSEEADGATNISYYNILIMAASIEKLK